MNLARPYFFLAILEGCLEADIIAATALEAAARSLVAAAFAGGPAGAFGRARSLGDLPFCGFAGEGEGTASPAFLRGTGAGISSGASFPFLGGGRTGGGGGSLIPAS